jgi:hypothetical protein
MILDLTKYTLLTLRVHEGSHGCDGQDRAWNDMSVQHSVVSAGMPTVVLLGHMQRAWVQIPLLTPNLYKVPVSFSFLIQ